MRIGILAPSPVPLQVGGAEKLWNGLLDHLNSETRHRADLVKLPVAEGDLWQVVDGYRGFRSLNVDHFDLVISGKYPAWMASHPRHSCYMLHALRGLYDQYWRDGRQEGEWSVEVFATLRFLRRHQRHPETLAEGFARIDALRGAAPLAAGRLPGPVAREVVHYLDSVAMAGLARTSAISQTVASRDAYFHGRLPDAVAHPPTSLRGLHCRRFEHLLTVGRRDNAKRVELVIRAMRHVTASVELLVAGAAGGNEELVALASADSRIRFLGEVSDAELVDLYADALAVVFVPIAEDFGMVALEGMLAGKPVITATDAGGPLELVQEGVTGRVVAPDACSLAAAIDALARSPADAVAMGRRGRERAAPVCWQTALPKILGGLAPAPTSRRRAPATKSVVVATTFPVTPPRSGGQVRAFQLYRHLARYARVTLVALADPRLPALDHEIAPGLREVRVPRSAAHQESETELSAAIDWVPVTDVALSLFHQKTPAYAQALAGPCRDADAVVACHPYALPVLAEVSTAPLWYEAQDVEADLKRSIFPDHPAGRELAIRVEEIERECCAVAARVLTCSTEDGDRLVELYGVARNIVRCVPNGVDIQAVAFRTLAERRLARARAGLDDRPTALFVGSYHGPNLDAVESLLATARRCPHIAFLVLGSVCMAPIFAEPPA
ncbi:MAG TPA: glycosyltransferase, partial [Thermoanaerobaculia bacterium]|nr:glycosyltransferase [Thermoanaerobaculia bacterium]